MPTVTGVYYLRPISNITSDMDDNCPFGDIDDNIFKGLNAHSESASEYCLNAGANSAFTSGVHRVSDIPANPGAVVSGVTLWSYSSGIPTGSETNSIFKGGGGGVDHLVSGSVKLDNQWFHDAYGPAMATSGAHDGAWAAYKFPEYEGSGLRDSAVSNMAINLVAPPQLADDEFRIYAAYLEVTWTQEVPLNHCSCHCPNRVSALVPNSDGTGATNFAIFGGPSNRYDAINNGVLTPDDSDYIRFTTSDTQTKTAFFGFEDMPVDFDVLTSGSLRIRDRAAGDQESEGVKYQFFHMDEMTPLTDEITNTDTDFSTTFDAGDGYRLINFNLTGKTDKTSWDNAVLKMTSYNVTEGTRDYRISEMELLVGYDRQPLLDPFPLSSGACCSYTAKFDDDLVTPCADSLAVHPILTETNTASGLKIANSLPVASINDHIATNGSGNRVVFSRHLTNLTSDWPSGTYAQVFQENASSWDILGTPINSGSYLTETLTDHLEIVSVDMNTSGDMFAVCWKDNQCIDCNSCDETPIPLNDDYHVGVYYWSDADSNWKRRGNYISSPVSAYIYANANAELIRNAGSFGDQIKITSLADRIFIKNSPADPNSQQSVEAYDWDGTQWNHYNTSEVGRLDYSDRYTDGIFDVSLSEYPVAPSGDDCPAPATSGIYNYTLAFESIITGNPDPANDYKSIRSNFASDVAIDSNDQYTIVAHANAYVHIPNDGVIKLLKKIGSSHATISNFFGELIYKDSNNSDFHGPTESAQFGFSADISSHGKFIVGGAPAYNSNRGYVKVHYQKSAQGFNETWSHLGQEIIGNYSYSAGQFGFDVAIATGKSSDTSLVSYNPVVVIGAPYVDQAGTDAGMIAIYRYKDKTTSTDAWELVQEIQGPIANGRFGYSVAIDDLGETIAVGMPHTTEKGRVYIYKYNSTTDQYEIKKSVLEDYPYESSFIEGEHAADLFGFSVDINGNDGNYVIAGAPNYGGGIVGQSNRGYVKSYIYKNNKWVTVQSDIDSSKSDVFIGGHTNRRLGYAVSISNDGTRIAFSALNASTGKSFVQVFDLIQPDASLPKWYYPVNIAGTNSPIISDGTSSYGSNISLGLDKIIISSNELGIDILDLVRTDSSAIVLANPHLHGPYADAFNSSVDSKLSTSLKKKSKTAYCLALRKQGFDSAGTKYSFFAPGQKWFLDPDLSIQYPDGIYKSIGPSVGTSEFEEGWAEISNGEVIKGGTLVSYDYPAANK